MFVKDYRNYMEPEYGEEAYAHSIWRPQKIVDSVLSELRSFTPVKDDDPAGLITMIIVVERCWLDLQRLKLEREMNTSTMITIIERLLPLTQKR